MKKIKKYSSYFISKISDVRITGQLIFAVLIILITWSGIQAIQTNYGLQKQINQLNKQNQLTVLKNNNIKLQNQYYNSNQYLELSARQNLGLANPGETELLVPNSVASLYVTKSVNTVNIANKVVVVPNYQKHFQDWVDFFLHRNN